MKITDVIEGILKKRGWGLYDKQDPLTKLPMSGEAPLFKVNEVELRYLLKDVKQAMEEEELKWNQENQNLLDHQPHPLIHSLRGVGSP